MSYFRKARNIELSMIYYLETEIAANWTGINVVKSFAQANEKKVPVVCIRLLDSNPTRFEIGNTDWIEDYGIIVDVFARSDGQRIDLSDFIMDKLKDGCVYYLHSHTSGDPTGLTRVADGRMTITSVAANRRVDFGVGNNVEAHDRFRHLISFTVRKYS